MKKLIWIAALLVVCRIGSAGQIDVQMAVMKDRAGLCIASNNGKSAFCNSFYAYYKIMYSGDAVTWAKYHIANGDINEGNVTTLTSIVDLQNAALKLISDEVRR